MTDVRFFHKCDCGSIIHVRDGFQNDEGKYVSGCKTCRTELPETGSISVQFGPGYYGSVYTGLNHPTLAEVEELPHWNYSIGSDCYPARFVRRISKTDRNRRPKPRRRTLRRTPHLHRFAPQEWAIQSRRRQRPRRLLASHRIDLSSRSAFLSGSIYAPFRRGICGLTQTGDKDAL